MTPVLIDEFAVGLGSIGGAAGLRETYNWSRSRRGNMAGYWMWITYSRTDGLPWTVEIAYLTHHPRKKEEKFGGAAWRVYDRQRPQCHWSRHWQYRGYHISRGYAGAYWASGDPAGGDGTMDVAPCHPSIKGTYTVSNSENPPPASGKSEVPNGEEIEWLKWPDVLTPEMKNVVACIPLDKAADLYPWHIRRKLGIPSLATLKIVGSVPFASAIVDPSLVLAMRQSEIEAGRLKEPKLPDRPLTRREIVGSDDEPVKILPTRPPQDSLSADDDLDQASEGSS
jgi:hypothetical protein